MRIASARVQAFMRAKRRYADLVKESPAFVKARIRLGRVLWMLEEFEASQLELEHALDQARDPAQRYLSSMFLGALYERKGDLAGARAAYEAARTAAPRSQAATVALGHLEVLAGRPDRAQALARELLSAPPVADEWWSYKNGGFEIAALAWLRSRVWQ
jgi:Flp pilus assembly protein TadD